MIIGIDNVIGQIPQSSLILYDPDSADDVDDDDPDEDLDIQVTSVSCISLGSFSRISIIHSSAHEMKAYSCKKMGTLSR